MMCSFHHTGEYNPSVSSIRILENENGAGYIVRLIEKNGVEGFACDQCRGLARPLCVKVCREEKDLADILKQFEQPGSTKQQSGGSCV